MKKHFAFAAAHGGPHHHTHPRGQFGPRGPFAQGGPGRRGDSDGRGSGPFGPGGFGPGNFGPGGFGPGNFGPGGFGPGGPGGHGPRGPRGPHGRRGGRAPRGDVRTAVLILLSEQPMHGYQLMQTIAERTGGRWSPSPGAIYPTLNQLEDEGLITLSKDAGRRLAALTPDGSEHVEANRATWSDPFGQPQEQGETPVDLRALMFDLGGIVKHVAQTGSEQQINAVAELLSQTKRAIYRQLAGEDDTATDQS